MRTNFLLSLLLATSLFLITSCKKDSTSNTSTDYFVKIKKEGVWVSYPITAGELGPDLLDGSLTDLGVAAYTTNNEERFDLTVQIKGTSFSTGTYTSDNTNYQTVITLFLINGSDISTFDIEDAQGMAPSRYTVNITSITADAITGKFEGNYLSDSFGSTPSIMNITEGEFHVKRIR